MNTKNLVENCGVRPQENSDGFRPSNTEKNEIKECLNCGIKLPTKSEWKENRDWQKKTGYCTIQCIEEHKESKANSTTHLKMKCVLTSENNGKTWIVERIDYLTSGETEHSKHHFIEESSLMNAKLVKCLNVCAYNE